MDYVRFHFILKNLTGTFQIWLDKQNRYLYNAIINRYLCKEAGGNEMPDYPNAQELFEKIMRLQGLLQRQRMQLRAARGPFADPTRGQGRVLAILKMKPEISTRDLSYLLDIRQQSLSELLSKMEKAGYIVRSPLETDRRVMVVKLTEKGENAQQENPDFSNLFDCLTQEEQNAFDGYLSRIISALETNLDGESREARWMEQTRAKMGDEAFERFLSTHGRGDIRSSARLERVEDRRHRRGRSDDT